MEGKITWTKEGEGNRPGSLRIGGNENYLTCWDFKNRKVGDTILYDISEKDYKGKPQYTIAISDDVPTQETIEPLIKGVVADDRQISIIAQNLTNRAYDAVIASLASGNTVTIDALKLAIFDAVEAYNHAKKLLKEPTEETVKDAFD